MALLVLIKGTIKENIRATEIEKEYDGSSSDAMVNEKRRTMIPIDPKDNLKVNYTILTWILLISDLLPFIDAIFNVYIE